MKTILWLLGLWFAFCAVIALAIGVATLFGG